MEEVRANGNVAGGIDAGGFEVADSRIITDRCFCDGELHRVIGEKFAVTLADFVPGGIGATEDAVAAMHAGAVHADIGLFGDKNRRGKIAILVHIHKMVACQPDNLRGGAVNTNAFRDNILTDVLRLVTKDCTDAVFAVGHAEARHFGPRTGCTTVQRVEHPHGIASTVDDVRIREMYKVPANRHGSRIEAVEGVQDRIADLQQAILGNICPVGVAGRAICTKSVVLAGQVHVGSVVHRIGSGDSPCLAEREYRSGSVNPELCINSYVVQPERIDAIPEVVGQIRRIRENRIHEGVYLVVSIEIRDGVVDGIGGNAVEAVTHGIALALRNLVPGNGELVRGHVVKCREFCNLCECFLGTIQRFFKSPTHRTDIRKARAIPLESCDEHGTVRVHHRIRSKRKCGSGAIHLEMNLVAVGLAAVRFRRSLELLVADVRAYDPAVTALGRFGVILIRDKNVFGIVIANDDRRVHNLRTVCLNIVAKRITEKSIASVMYTKTLII